MIDADAFWTAVSATLGVAYALAALAGITILIGALGAGIYRLLEFGVSLWNRRRKIS